MIFLRKNNDFLGFEPQKIHPKLMSNRIGKNIEKKQPKNRFWHRLWPPKTSQNRSKIEAGREKMGSRTKPVLRSYGNHPQVSESQRGA